MNKIADYEINQEAVVIGRMSNATVRQTSAGADYLSFRIFDGVDTVSAQIWNLTDDIKARYKNGEVYRFEGRLKDFRGNLQMTVSAFEQVDPNEMADNIQDFYEYAPLTEQELREAIGSYIVSISNDILRQVVEETLARFDEQFYIYPAAVSIHHSYISGLAYHTYSMLRLSESYLKMYPFINADLVRVGIILHDVGKIIELSDHKGPSYTKAGHLIGHLVSSALEVSKTAELLGVGETEEVLNLIHIILSHHGLMEHGSPKVPLTAEALVVHYVDLADSRFDILKKELKELAPGEKTQRIFALENNEFYLPDLEDETEER